MQDMGAGGLLCSSLELVQRGRDKTKKNLGCTLFVDNIPTKYYLEPSNRIISESQERMLLVVNPDFVQKVFDIFEKWDLQYSLVGVVNYSGKYNIIDNNENVLYEEDITNFTDIVEHWPENRVENNFPIIEKVKNQLWEQYDTTIGVEQ